MLFRSLTNGNGIGYTVPQKIRKGAEEAEIFFRVRQIFKNSAILVMDGDNQLAKFRREHLAPGEMEKIKIPNALMKRIVSDKLTVSVEEA